MHICLNSRYGSGFGVYGSSSSSSITSFHNERVFVQEGSSNCQSSSKHFLDLGTRVLNFKEVFLAHILVFLGDSKDILLLKGLLINHFKSSREFS